MAIQDIQPIFRRQITQATIDRLLSMISEGYWSPGDKLPPQRELAKALDVGMSTLREALQSLQTMGILNMRHGDGTYVAGLPLNDMYAHMVNFSMASGEVDLPMLFEARLILETGFAFIAAERATEEQIAQLFDILENEKQNILANDKEHTHAYDLAFHRMIATMAENKFLEQINVTLFAAMDDLLRAIPQTMEGWQWHYDVANEIRNRNPFRASEAMRTLIHASAARIVPILAKGKKKRPLSSVGLSI